MSSLGQCPNCRARMHQVSNTNKWYCVNCAVSYFYREVGSDSDLPYLRQEPLFLPGVKVSPAKQLELLDRRKKQSMAEDEEDEMAAWLVHIDSHSALQNAPKLPVAYRELLIRKQVQED